LRNAPLELRESGRASFHCDTIEQGRLATQELSDYRAIALIDPAPLTADVWKKNGGEVIIFPDAETKAYLTQVESIAPAVLGASPAMKADFDLLSETAKKLNQ